ncbi:MAG: hypothetical protein KDC44_21030 [Phaeodactylibacter sp.]|nr:hypothetical protein [Phaeodactylibacter sp.]
MKKWIFVIALIGLVSANLNAQIKKMQADKGDFSLDLGVGVIPFFAIDNGTTDVWPISLNLSYRIQKHFTVAAFAGYTAATSAPILLADGIPVQYRNNQWVFGLKGAAHAYAFDRVEFYGGIQMGYSLPNVTELSAPLSPGQEPIDPTAPSQDAPYKYKPATGKMVYGGFVGSSFLISERISVFGEVGYGVALLNAGVSLKW